MSQNHVNWFYVKELPLPMAILDPTSRTLISKFAWRLTSIGYIGVIGAITSGLEVLSPSEWAITPHERLRLRCMLDAIIAVLYGLNHDDFAWILKDCDHPKVHLSNKAFCRQLDPKGFWRVGKTEDPELRHSVLSLAAFNDLHAAIATANGDRKDGIQAFCDQNEGDGWMLPETLCLKDLDLPRTVNAGDYDERACTPQPVHNRMGERFLDWQLAQIPDENWAECERHAKMIIEGMPTPTQEEIKESGRSESIDLSRPAIQLDLFGNPMDSPKGDRRKRRKG
jgi:hypothetical protein